MTDFAQAVSVTSTVDIDWAELGRVFAGQLSGDQAEFFLGFYEAVNDVQLAYIGDEAVFDANKVRNDVSGLLENLAYFIRSQGGTD